LAQLDEAPSQLLALTVQEMYLFSSVFLQMQHDVKDKDSSTLEEFICLAY
jgi:hypothetical protein